MRFISHFREQLENIKPDTTVLLVHKLTRYIMGQSGSRLTLLSHRCQQIKPANFQLSSNTIQQFGQRKPILELQFFISSRSVVLSVYTETILDEKTLNTQKTRQSPVLYWRLLWRFKSNDPGSPLLNLSIIEF